MQFAGLDRLTKHMKATMKGRATCRFGIKLFVSVIEKSDCNVDMGTCFGHSDVAVFG